MKPEEVQISIYEIQSFVYITGDTKSPRAAKGIGAAPAAIVNVEDEERWHALAREVRLIKSIRHSRPSSQVRASP